MINMKRYQSWRQATPEERAYIENVVKREYIRMGDVMDALLETAAGFSLLLWMSVPTVTTPFYQDWRLIVFFLALVVVGIHRFFVSHRSMRILILPLDDASDMPHRLMRRARVFDLPENWSAPVIVRCGRRLMQFC